MYVAIARANAEVAHFAWHAWLMLSSTKKVVKTVVGRPRQASSVKGLNRYL